MHETFYLELTKRTGEIIVPDSHMLTIYEGSEGDDNGDVVVETLVKLRERRSQ